MASFGISFNWLGIIAPSFLHRVLRRLIAFWSPNSLQFPSSSAFLWALYTLFLHRCFLICEIEILFPLHLLCTLIFCSQSWWQWPMHLGSFLLQFRVWNPRFNLLLVIIDLGFAFRQKSAEGYCAPAQLKARRSFPLLNLGCPGGFYLWFLHISVICRFEIVQVGAISFLFNALAEWMSNAIGAGQLIGFKVNLISWSEHANCINLGELLEVSFEIILGFRCWSLDIDALICGSIKWYLLWHVKWGICVFYLIIVLRFSKMTGHR